MQTEVSVIANVMLTIYMTVNTCSSTIYGKAIASRANLPTRFQGDAPRGNRPRGERRAATEAHRP
ncbi:hypothetical protein [Scytonema hofmannii]|uniref:hypothetical protein n=1 Tax=Scytonema hofmannii TaxID=34078 RepID=UPI0011E01AD2|nr:hypothetical protein [Scytonema hofmannii]